MCAKWVGGKIPKKQLEFINKKRFLNKDGKISINGWMGSLPSSVVHTHIEWEEELPALLKDAYIGRCFFYYDGKKKQLTAQDILGYLTKKEKAYQKHNLEEYHLLTYLNVYGTPPIKQLKFNNCEFKFLPKNIKKYDNNEQFKRLKSLFKNEKLTLGWPILVTCKSKSAIEALDITVQHLDSLLGIWDWLRRGADFYGETYGGIHHYLPLQSGPIKTIHDTKGMIKSEYSYYSDSLFVFDKKVKWDENIALFKKNTLFLVRKISNHPMRDDLINIFGRFSRILEFNDKETIFLGMWGLIEYMVGSPKGSDVISKRVSSLFQESEFVREKMGHLAKRRHRLIHRDELTFTDINALIYQSRQFVHVLIKKIMFNEFNCQSMDEFGEFLEMSSRGEKLDEDIEKNNRRTEILIEAHKFANK